MKLLRWINFEVPVYWGSAWPQYVTRRCFRVPLWYLLITAFGLVHIVTSEYNSINTHDHLHIVVLLFVWIVYTMFLLMRIVWNLATIQYQAREYECLACEYCCCDMRGAEDGSECPDCGANWDHERGSRRWKLYCDWAKRHNKRVRSHLKVESGIDVDAVGSDSSE